MSNHQNIDTIMLHNNLPYRGEHPEEDKCNRIAEMPVLDIMCYFFPGLNNERVRGGASFDEQLLEISAVKALLGIDDWNDMSKIRVFFNSQHISSKSKKKVTIPRVMQIKLGVPKLRGRRVYRFADIWLELHMNPDLEKMRRSGKVAPCATYPTMYFKHSRPYSIYMDKDYLESICPGQSYTSHVNKENMEFMDDAIHPHISQGKACWGDREGQINNSMYKGQIVDLIASCRQFINIWNRTGAYWDINHVWRQISRQGGTLRDLKLDEYIIAKGDHSVHEASSENMPESVKQSIRAMGITWVQQMKKVSEWTGLNMIGASQLIQSLMYDMSIAWEDCIKEYLDIGAIRSFSAQFYDIYPWFHASGTDDCNGEACLGVVSTHHADHSADDIAKNDETGKYIDYQDDIFRGDVPQRFKHVTPLGNAWLRMENARSWLNNLHSLEAEWPAYCIRSMNGRDWRRYLRLSKKWKYRIDGFNESAVETDFGLRPYIEKIAVYMDSDWLTNNMKKALTLIAGGLSSLASHGGYRSVTYDDNGERVENDFTSFVMALNIKVMSVPKDSPWNKRMSSEFPIVDHLVSANKLLEQRAYQKYISSLKSEINRIRRYVSYEETTINNTPGDAPEGEISPSEVPENGVERSRMVQL
tara:strand:- start:707 stop:2635 length:1929 start_codon:yes stop_codon:yes gene_type:complete